MWSIRSWYIRQAKIPLLVLIATTIVIQLSYVLIVILQNNLRYEDQTQRLIRSVSIALLQKNRVMLESLMNSEASSHLFNSVILCIGGQPVLSVPPLIESCTTVKPGFYSRVQTFPISGFAEYQIVFVAPIVKLSPELLSVSAITLSLSLVAIFLILLTSSRFESQILKPILDDFETEETSQIREFNQLRERRKRLVELEKSKAISDLARQVAHDIRSPLSALKIFATKQSQSLSEDDSKFLSIAINRIVSIADDLLDRSRPKKSYNLDLRSLISVSDSVIQEKRKATELGKLQISLTDKTNGVARSISIDHSNWARIVSILLDNSIESYSELEGRIELTFNIESDRLIFRCIDSGQGMSVPDLARVRDTGESIGKVVGNGLGVNFVKSTIHKVGGEFKIDSEFHKGTAVIIMLPLT
jgi:signal transduction histidine kinase